MIKFSLVIAILQLINCVNGHGYISCPLPRQYRDVKPYSWTNWVAIVSGGNFAGGIGNAPNLNANIPGGPGGPPIENTRGHGICGDEMPRNGFTAASGIYGPTTPRATYVAGGILDIEIMITAWHGGHLEFRVCDIENVDNIALEENQTCFNEHVLKINENTPEYPASAGEGSTRFDYMDLLQGVRCPNNHNMHWPHGSCCNDGGECSDPENNDDRWVLPSASSEPWVIHLDIPDDLDCEHCVLQMYYQTGNSVDNYPEAFWNCVDIKIHPKGTNAVTGCSVGDTPALNSVSPVTPHPTQAPAPTLPPVPTVSPTLIPTTSPIVAPTSSPIECVADWGQCGGNDHVGSHECCNSNYQCVYDNEWYSQCMPNSNNNPNPPPPPPNNGAYATNQSSDWGDNYAQYSATGNLHTAAAGSSYDKLVAWANVLATDIPLDANLLAVHSSGGAAGGVVSEGQGYGLVISAATLAAMEAMDSNRATVMDYFYKFFRGWQRMCMLSVDGDNCQSDEGYRCGSGQYPCLPHWKFDDNLVNRQGTGSAPDGDEDAMLGMMLAFLAVKDDTTQPTWLDEVGQWTYDTCDQFMASNTIKSDTTDRRIVKLGSCWGGWGDNGQNPSYHAPAAYRMCRDFMKEYDTDYGSSSTHGDGLEASWNELVSTSYEVFKATQCQSTGTLTNWAKIYEQNDDTLLATIGFSGSNTPSTEFGSEASRTMWRVSLDYQLFPAEAGTDAADFLSLMANQVILKESSSMFSELTLDTACIVSSIHSSWQWNAFMYGPIFTSLVVPAQGADQTRQQEVLDVAGAKVKAATISDYYSGSWIAISTISLNGDFVKAKSVLPSITSSPSTPSPTYHPITSVPTANPTPIPSTSKPSLHPTDSPTHMGVTQSPSKAPTPTPTPSPTTSQPTPAPTTPQPTPNPTPSPTPPPTTSQPTPAPTTPHPTPTPTHSPSPGPTTPQPTPSPSPSPTPAPGTPNPSTSPSTICVAQWGQCAGTNFNGGLPLPCCPGFHCAYDSQWYSQCLSTPKTASPTAPSPNGPGCCSWWGGVCGDCGDGWCHESSERCGQCGGTFLGGMSACSRKKRSSPSQNLQVVQRGCCSFNATGECGKCESDHCHMSEDICLHQCGGHIFNNAGRCYPSNKIPQNQK